MVALESAADRATTLSTLLGCVGGTVRRVACNNIDEMFGDDAVCSRIRVRIGQLLCILSVGS